MASGGSAGRSGSVAGAAQPQATTEEAEVERLKAQREVELREAAEVRCWERVQPLYVYCEGKDKSRGRQQELKDLSGLSVNAGSADGSCC